MRGKPGSGYLLDPDVGEVLLRRIDCWKRDTSNILLCEVGDRALLVGPPPGLGKELLEEREGRSEGRVDWGGILFW